MLFKLNTLIDFKSLIITYGKVWKL